MNGGLVESEAAGATTLCDWHLEEDQLLRHLFRLSRQNPLIEAATYPALRAQLPGWADIDSLLAKVEAQGLVEKMDCASVSFLCLTSQGKERIDWLTTTVNRLRTSWLQDTYLLVASLIATWTYYILADKLPLSDLLNFERIREIVLDKPRPFTIAVLIILCLTVSGSFLLLLRDRVRRLFRWRYLEGFTLCRRRITGQLILFEMVPFVLLYVLLAATHSVFFSGWVDRFLVAIAGPPVVLLAGTLALLRVRAHTLGEGEGPTMKVLLTIGIVLIPVLWVLGIALNADDKQHGPVLVAMPVILMMAFWTAPQMVSKVWRVDRR